MSLHLPLVAAAVLAAASSPTPRPSPGPASIIAMHEELFAALDRGDSTSAQKFVAAQRKGPAGPATLFLVDAAGEELRAEDPPSARELLARLASDSKAAGGSWSTKITSSWADCDSPELSCAVIEFDRAHAVEGKSKIRRYRGTSLVRYEDDRWRLVHWHVSRAPERK